VYASLWSVLNSSNGIQNGAPANACPKSALPRCLGTKRAADVSVCLNRVTPSSMHMVRRSNATGTTLIANAYASQVASSLQTRNGTPTCVTGSARQHLVTTPNTSTSTNANASATSKYAPRSISSTLSPATASAFKSKVAQAMNIGTTSSASASANPRRAPLLNTGIRVCVAAAARLMPARRLSISTTSVVAASASLSTATHLELEDSNYPKRSGLTTRIARASVSIQPTRLTKTTNSGSSIQIFATGDATQLPAPKASTSTQCSASAPALTQPVQQAMSGARLPANASASTETLRVQACSNGTPILAPVSHARNQSQDA